MTYDEALKQIQAVKPNLLLPPIKRNKSWLMIYGDSEGKLHFYDVKYSPEAAFERINAAHIKDARKTEMVDILAYTSVDEAEMHAKALRDAQLTIDYYRGCISQAVYAAKTPAAVAAAVAATKQPEPREYVLTHQH